MSPATPTMAICRHRKLMQILTARALALLLLLGPALASGHAVVVESSPANGAILEQSPDQVTLRFNSMIERALTRAVVTGPDGQSTPLPLPAAEPGASARTDRLTLALPPLPPGSYLVRYKVLAVDGHVTEGVVRFEITGAR